MRIMRRWAIGLAQGAELLRTASLVRVRTKVARSFTTRARRDASPMCPCSALISGHSQRLRWRCSSQLIHASSTAGPPPRPTNGELQHDVDVLVEGTPLPDARRALCTYVALLRIVSELAACARCWMPCCNNCRCNAPSTQPLQCPGRGPLQCPGLWGSGP